MNTKTNTKNQDAVISVALRLLTDREFRQQLRDGHPDALTQIGIGEKVGVDISAGVKVVTSTREITYLPMPMRVKPGQVVSAEELARIQGGATSRSEARSYISDLNRWLRSSAYLTQSMNY